MSFIWPYALISLLLLPLFAWLYLRLRHRQAKSAATLGPLGLVQNQAGRALGRRRHLPTIFFLSALALLLIALARPEMTASLPRVEGTVILAFDVSNSMNANDLEPTRLDAAKAAARAFVDNQPSTIQIGVVAFGNGGLITQPPTNVRGDVLAAVNRLSVEGGTSLGQGIFTALNAVAGEPLALDDASIDPRSGSIDASQLEIDDYSSAVILLLTDGENTGPPEPLEIAQIAAEAGVRIYPVGIGSDGGAVIEVDGFNLVTQLDEVLLEEIANVTNGVYYRAEDEESLREIYETVDLQLTLDPQMMEVTSLFAGLSTVLLLIGAGLSMAWLGRMP